MRYEIYLCVGNPPFHKIFYEMISLLAVVLKEHRPRVIVEILEITIVPKAEAQKTAGVQRIFFNLHSLTSEHTRWICYQDWVFNYEQLAAYAYTNNYVGCLQTAVCIDYSPTNFRQLTSHFGFGQKVFHPIIKEPAQSEIRLSRPDRENSYKYDFFFIGSLNDRRVKTIQTITRAGYTVDVAFNLFGEDLYKRAEQSRYILNIHYYESKIIEVFRIIDFLGRGFKILTESSSATDWAGYDFLGKYVHTFSLESIPNDIENALGALSTPSPILDVPNLMKTSMHELVTKLDRTNSWLEVSDKVVRPDSTISSVAFAPPVVSEPRSKFSIDVIIPTYKSEFLEATIRSVMSAPSPFERRIFISDNCPDDTVENLCRKLPVIYSRSEYKGVRNFYYGISRGSGTLIHILCDDDLVYSSFYVEMCERYLKYSPAQRQRRYWAGFSGSHVIDESGKVIRTRSLDNLEVISVELVEACIRQCVNPFGELSGLVFERTWVNHVGIDNIFSTMPGRQWTAPDFQIIMNLAVSAHLDYISEPLFAWRYGHSSQETAYRSSKPNHIMLWALLNDWRGGCDFSNDLFDLLPSDFRNYHECDISFLAQLIGGRPQ
jgi:hypothetical protein